MIKYTHFMISLLFLVAFLASPRVAGARGETQSLSFDMRRDRGRVTKYDEYVTDKRVLEFFKNGHIEFRDLLPSLRDVSMQREVLHTFHIGKLDYTDFTLNAFRQRGFDCERELKDDQCGSYFEMESEFVNYREDILTEIFELNMNYLHCCLNVIHQYYSNTQFFMPYFQVVNGHRINSAINGIALDKQIGRLASTFLQVPSVRLYQTAIFVKNGSSVNTNTEWHQDLNMVPIDVFVGGYLTFWCPLSPLHHSNEDSLLWFADGSHRDSSRYHWFDETRHLFKSDEVKLRYNLSSFNLEVGDCTAHHGWTLHAAQKQPKSNSARIALAFSYVNADARVLDSIGGESNHRDRGVPDEDAISYGRWLSDLKEGDIIDHFLLPVVFP